MLQQDGQLLYYSGAELKGTIKLSPKAYCRRESSKNFELINNNRSWHLSADKDGVCDGWISALGKVIVRL